MCRVCVQGVYQEGTYRGIQGGYIPGGVPPHHTQGGIYTGTFLLPGL